MGKLKYCGFKAIDTIDEIGNELKAVVPIIEKVRVKINPSPKDDSEYYIILD